MASKKYIKLRARLMRDEEIAFGPGKADLLAAIDRTGSISAAARDMMRVETDEVVAVLHKSRPDAPLPEISEELFAALNAIRKTYEI